MFIVAMKHKCMKCKMFACGTDFHEPKIGPKSSLKQETSMQLLEDN